MEDDEFNEETNIAKNTLEGQTNYFDCLNLVNSYTNAYNSNVSLYNDVFSQSSKLKNTLNVLEYIYNLKTRKNIIFYN